MSLLLRPEFLPNKAPMLTIVMAYSVATALREQTGLDFRIKWPNDIVLNGKKVVGILTEMSTEIEYINHVVIGVGSTSIRKLFRRKSVRRRLRSDWNPERHGDARS